jgi:cation diffusion facilitator family transporter
MNPWEHDHTFGQDEKKPGEVRTLVVVLLTAATMVLEIVAGIAYGSMALLADGLHMASHATALTISMVAYVYARRYARDERFSFGTGKINSLAGFTGAILLAVFALMMAWESVERLISPVPIAFNQAILVAVIGLIVNGVSVFILGHNAAHEQGHDHGPDDAADAHGHSHDHVHHHDHDHNLRSAYLHVLADTLTSLLAIFALLSGKYFGLNWLDPVMGVVGAILVARWSIGLLSTTSRVLLDRQGPRSVRESIFQEIRDHGDEVCDLHLWAVGPGAYALIIGIVTENPRPPSYYRKLLPTTIRLVHVSVELWSSDDSVLAGESTLEDRMDKGET